MWREIKNKAHGPRNSKLKKRHTGQNWVGPQHCKGTLETDTIHQPLLPGFYKSQNLFSTKRLITSSGLSDLIILLMMTDNDDTMGLFIPVTATLIPSLLKYRKVLESSSFLS